MNYTDGVPVKIGEKFKPPARITLPLNFQQRDPTSLLNEEYDFDLERHVLELAESYRKRKEEKARAKDEKVGSQIEQFSRQPVAVSDGSSNSSDNSPSGSSILPSSGDSNNDPAAEASPQSEVSEQPPINNAIMANLEGSDILKPVPSDNLGTSQSQCEYRAINNIKLEDFEAESSPFDSMELKTLNDMEELKSVLQGMSSVTEQTMHGISSNVASTTANSATEPSKPAVNGVTYFYPCAIERGPETVATGLSEFTMSVTTSGYPSMYKNITTSSDPTSTAMQNDLYAMVYKSTNQFSSNSTKQPNANYSSTPCSVSWTMPPVSTFNSYSTQGNLKTQVAALDTPISDFGTLTSTYFSSETPVSTYQSAVITPSSEPNTSTGSLRNARSTPDLLKELGRTRKDEKRSSSAVRPPRPTSVASVEDAADINSSYEQKKKQFFNGLCNPYLEMEESEQGLVQKLVDMGFPPDRTARAVKKFGIDDKKIIDHLCAVQSLIEKGYNSEKSELALFLYEDDEEVAKYFLQLLKQFLDLGFEEEAIKKALYLTKNDRDKALDYLVS